MRITGGRFGGRILRAPASDAIRPTSDRIRQAIFNLLEHGYDAPITGARAIDLFAGAGCLGFETLSRGARYALFVDSGAEARALLRANIEMLGVGGVSRIFRRDALKLGKALPGETFDLALLDPPYSKNPQTESLAPQALVALRDGGWLSPNALCVIEETARAAIALPESFDLADARVYGETQILIARFKPPPQCAEAISAS